jgi:hypothetical protein
MMDQDKEDEYHPQSLQHYDGSVLQHNRGRKNKRQDETDCQDFEEHREDIVNLRLDRQYQEDTGQLKKHSTYGIFSTYTARGKTSSCI